MILSSYLYKNQRVCMQIQKFHGAEQAVGICLTAADSRNGFRNFAAADFRQEADYVS